MTDLERNSGKPAHRYIRQSDKLPTMDTAYETPLAKLTATIKLFDPTGAATWYIGAYDADSRRAYAVSDLGWGPEAGTISMQEIVDLKLRFGLKVERDLYWTPKTFAAILKAGELV